ncbi:P-type conjugative transfer protein TrbL, partial [Mycobacterium tuberculosis]
EPRGPSSKRGDDAGDSGGGATNGEQTDHRDRGPGEQGSSSAERGDGGGPKQTARGEGGGAARRGGQQGEGGGRG